MEKVGMIYKLFALVMLLAAIFMFTSCPVKYEPKEEDDDTDDDTGDDTDDDTDDDTGDDTDDDTDDDTGDDTDDDTDICEAAYWTFDEGSGTTAADSWGSYDLTLTSNALWSTSGCHQGNCFKNTLLYNYAGIQGNTPLDGALKGKIDMWVKFFSLGSQGGERTILCHGNWDYPSDDDLSIFTYSHAGHDMLRTALRDIGEEVYFLYEPVATNTWYHFVLEWDGSQFCMTVNGNPANPPCVDQYSALMDKDWLRLGFGAYSNNNRPFDGLIDEVKIWTDVACEQENWHIYTLDSAGDVGDECSIAIDSSDKVHISYYDRANGDLKYATNKSGSWQTFTLDSAGEAGWFSSIALDSSDKVHISHYAGHPGGHLQYTTNKSGEWQSFTLDSGSETGRWSSIAIDSNNKVHISYYDDANRDLKYATNAEVE